MKSLLFFVLVVHVLYGAAKDVTCKKKGKFSKTITIGSGDSYTFDTQAKEKYGGNVKCKVTYKRGSSCPKLRFSCSKFNIENKMSNCSRKTGDRMIIKEHGSKMSKSYCKKKSPDVSTTSKFLKVSFISNKRKHSTGAKCMIRCESDTTTLPYPTYPTTTTKAVYADCKCGMKREGRIVGGSATEINEYPWMAAISTTEESQFCGGSLIGSRWVITATHCMFKDKLQTIPRTAEDIVVVLGEHDLEDANESKLPRKVVKVSQIIKHENYDKTTINNDIALLKLAEEVDLLTYTPVCLPKTGDNFDGRNAWVYGWGSTSYAGDYPTELLEVEVTVVNNSVCQAAMPLITITEDMLCAGGQMKDACQGDSGGPLTVDVAGAHVLVGDVSFGLGCGDEDTYGVYGDVAYFRTWIDDNIWRNGGAEYCLL